MSGLGVHALDGITLEELIEQSALQTRVDRKYVVPREAVALVLAELSTGTRVLDIDGLRTFGYRSV